MSVSSVDDKAGGAAVPFRCLLTKHLAGAIPLAVLLLWSADAFAVRGSSRPFFLQIRGYLGPISTKSLSTAAAVASPLPIPPAFPKSWISSFNSLNYTSTIISRWLTPGGEACRDSHTAAISIPALQSSSLPVFLTAGDIHEFTFLALDVSLRPRCIGGDYFETDLSSASWKSRPPIHDHGNGSYTFRLQLHPRFASENATFTLSIVLLFRSFDCLKLSPDRFSVRRELSRISIKFLLPLPFGALSDLQICRASDFAVPAWSGRWTRLTRNDSCAVDRAGRYRCLDPALPCEQPWCAGSLAALESNGWVYSAHCAFRLFDHSSAWRCLRGKWLLFWGDSNHVDTIRNLLNFVLGLVDIDAVPRRFDRYFSNPRNDSETLRITNVFNGHWNDSLNYLGLASLRNPPFRSLLWKYLDEPGGRAPDAIVLNSGLHDGIYWKSVRSFANGAEDAARYWEALMARVHRKQPAGEAFPRVFYRTTVATGGFARDMGFNPCKMETFDGILKEKLAARGVLTGGVVDEFDMTFPWHYDNRCNDGVHYGRKPAMAKWRDGQIGHQYFVDLMLVHVLLNAFCNG
ncbi:hypothetical protein IEQ34_000359 [Dendrobium chrysotoxum]|uniref:Uncharacterized protein n=1 Tax=Dendrobium chrysotoxum TaxID=161865 RepID=A0AAV7HNV6_DENCH|nr:hypothetical protein IEQ34_000359 [Dendrobium chrysotoxum]